MAAAAPTAESQLLVRAIRLGFYPDAGATRARARQPGEVFRLLKAEHFAGEAQGAFQWMVWADAPRTPGEADVGLTDVPIFTAEKRVIEPSSILSPVPSPVPLPLPAPAAGEQL